MKLKLMHSRREFVQQFAGGAAALASVPHSPWLLAASQRPWNPDVAIVGGSLGGVAAALAALRRGAKILITEETAWLGGAADFSGSASRRTPLDRNQRLQRQLPGFALTNSTILPATLSGESVAPVCPAFQSWQWFGVTFVP